VGLGLEDKAMFLKKDKVALQSHVTAPATSLVEAVFRFYLLRFIRFGYDLFRWGKSYVENILSAPPEKQPLLISVSCV
jgi:hypothetical protein